MSTQTLVPRIPKFTLSDRLRKARETAELDQSELGKLIGVSRNSISAAERGASKPRKSVLIAWAFATRVPFEWLTTGQANENPDPDGPGNADGLLRVDSNHQPSDYNPDGQLVAFLTRKRPRPATWINPRTPRRVA
jgi:transcriptional regulator with XRE-family HTH domain|nr:MAG TPA: helix-turn-helix domain protein [Caudoviricetes sp.]